MKELVRSNDAVLLSYIEALFKDAGIAHAIMDVHMSVVEGTIGILQRRVMVAEEDVPQARRILSDAGLGYVTK